MSLNSLDVLVHCHQERNFDPYLVQGMVDVLYCPSYLESPGCLNGCDVQETCGENHYLVWLDEQRSDLKSLSGLNHEMSCDDGVYVYCVSCRVLIRVSETFAA